jgi:hypothetical protein
VLSRAIPQIAANPCRVACSTRSARPPARTALPDPVLPGRYRRRYPVEGSELFVAEVQREGA